jgi:TPR repeat protein
MVKQFFFNGCILLLIGTCSRPASAQDSTKAAVFKEHRAPTLNFVRRSDESYELWEEFKLMEKANNGDASAQHELGIRYLLGRGFGVDTVKSAYWIQKAADQGFVIAQYNLGIFLNNGWGLPWNPFKAFEHFQYAAKQGMPEAEYVYGSILTDNLVAPQNWIEACRWMKKAADAGYQPAREALVEFEKRGIDVHADSSDTSSVSLLSPGTKKDSVLVPPTHSWKPVLLDFSDETATKQDELAFLKDMLRKGSPELKNALGISSLDADKLVADSSLLILIQSAADVGSPEALAVLGRFYEKGIIERKNLMLAATEYLRAIRLEFPRAPALLWNVFQDKKFVQQMHALVLKDNADAEFVCAGLISVGFDNELPPEESFQLLLKASAQQHIQAMIEAGLCYFSGRGVEKNKEKAVEFWSRAAALGNREAQIRLAATNVIADLQLRSYASSIPDLDSAAHKGSLLAQVALAYCYETGTGVSQSKPEAVRLYRESAYRGSQIAYYALKKMYDELRPNSVQYRIKEE